MEKIVNQDERIKRAEEIYLRRKSINGSGIRVSSNSVNKSKKKLSLFKKMFLQLAICSIIYIVFYLIKNSNYIFSEDVISKTKELLSYDINFNNVYLQVTSFIDQNKDKFTVKEDSLNTNEIKQENQGMQKESGNEIENGNTIEDNNEVIDNSNQVDSSQGGIGGAEAEETKDKESEIIKKSQMEVDADYVKKQCKFKVPVKGVVTSRYGAREETEIISANHQGIDIGADTGTPIYASIEGTVKVVSSEGDYRKAC